MLPRRSAFWSFVLTLISVTIFFPTYRAQAESPWAMVGANSARTFQSTRSGPGEDIALLWKSQTPPDAEQFHYGPVYATVSESGSVFALSHNLYAFGPGGQLLYQKDLGPAYNAGTEVGVISGDTLYAGLVNTLHAFDVSGNELDEYTIPGPLNDFYFKTPAIAPDGEIILPMRKDDDSIGSACALANMWWVDGSLTWMFELGNLNILYPPAVNQNSIILVSTANLNDVYASETPASLLCFLSSGELFWRQDNIVLGMPLVDNANNLCLVRSSLDHREAGVIAMNMTTGAVEWEFTPSDLYYDDGINSGRGFPLAMDSAHGIYYAFWQRGWDDSSLAGVLTAINRDGALLWSNEWSNNRERRYSLMKHPIVDADGCVYIFYSYVQLEQGIEQSSVGCCDVFDSQGEEIAHEEFPSSSTDLNWSNCEPAVGPDNRIYMFAQDFDFPVTCSLYAFGKSSESTEARPKITTAGYGLSEVTDQGGSLSIEANVYHPQGASKISSVDVLINGQSTGYSLTRGDSPDEFSLELNIDAGMLAPGRFLLELMATDVNGNTSDIWPYFTVGAATAD
ncbi:MAG: PQQ-like beta-propeller repeat protein [Candidatus Coatesbacteria bacterium]|nr:PQQ-like beta-propeller repeat protein [Candidatus Coatesbacteria bacterium]